MLRRAVFGGVIIAAASVAVASCDPIEPHPISDAPMNACPDHPCEAYEKGTRTAPRCQIGRCEIVTAGSRPEFPFWIVVHVPDSAIFAPGTTYVFFSDERGEPAFKKSQTPGVVSNCVPPQCLSIGQQSSVTGFYQVTRQASLDVGYPLAEGTSIPVRAVYEPIGNEQQDTFPDLSLDILFATSRVFPTSDVRVLHNRSLLFGQYLRVLYPEPPFDAYFPPRADKRKFLGVNIEDGFKLSDPNENVTPKTPLDDVTQGTREATVSRTEGLDGWRVWLVDHPSGRRISVVKTLQGVKQAVRLDTSGENRASGGGVGLGDDVDAVVAPPETWTAVPRLVTPLPGGAGLANLDYKSLPPPVTVSGVVALPTEVDGGTLYGYAARVTFESATIATRSETANPLLHYSTTMNTDDRGRFATVLPPGSYFATVEPAAGTGRAKARLRVAVDRTVTTLTLQPAAQTPVRGRVVLTDERPLSEATVLAIPEAPESPSTPMPRPGRTTTGPDGSFLVELDPGPYVFTIIPKAGTGFPRLVTPREVPAEATELPELRVPPPIKLSFTLRDPTPIIHNPIARAIVRVFAQVPGAGATRPPLEIGSAMTDTDGQVEILLAQEPR
jgi:hypothetical protein